MTRWDRRRNEYNSKERRNNEVEGIENRKVRIE